MTRARISTHFTVEEFDCHNGQPVPGFALEPLRLWAEVWGEPLRKRFGAVSVTSGFRPGAYNRSVGGVAGSCHVYDARDGGSYRSLATGVAADVTCRTGAPADWQAWALAHQPQRVHPSGHRMGGVGSYASFVHLDTGSRRVWRG